MREWKGDVLFLRRVIEGPASQSYGIQVAGLAGVPDSIVSRAKEILANLEKNELTASGEPILAAGRDGGGDQLALFAQAPDPIRRELAGLDVDNLTPVEALNRLVELKRRATEDD